MKKGPLKRWCFNGPLFRCCIELLFVVWCRRFLTLPQPPGCSTISAGRLSFRVRNGSGRFPAAIGHRQTLEAFWPWVLCQILCSGREHDSVNSHVCVCVVNTSLLGVSVCLFWSISTSRLNTLRCVQFWPINPIVFGGPSNETSS